MIHAAKDMIASKAARTYVNNLIARYGKVEELSIDSRNQRVRIICSLDGESVPITIDVDRYVIRDEGARKMVELESCRCSRRWIETLLIDYVKGRKFELPSWAAAAL